MAVILMQIRLLGSVDIHDDHESRGLKGLRRKSILALLALHPGEFMATDHIVSTVWGDAPPSTAVNALQHHVAYLRGMLGGPDTIQWKDSGYVLRDFPDITDVEMARRLVDQATREPRARAAELLSTALGLWHGRALDDLSGSDYFAEEATRLDGFRLSIHETLMDLRLRLSRHSDVIQELEMLVRANPFREQLRAFHIVALYRTGRQSDALDSYRDIHRLLREELGVDPGVPLKDLQARILRQDPELHVVIPSRPGGVADMPASPPRNDPQDKPPPVGKPVPGWYLPATVTSFVGRVEEMRLLLEALDASRITTVIGIGGAGKTRLALKVAERAGARFPDGVFFVDLASTAASDVPRQVADAVGVQEDDHQLLRSLQTVLSRRCLLILDNCERVVAACASLVEALAARCPQLRILATSREPLRTYGEKRMPLAPLPLPPRVPAVPDREDLAALRKCSSVELFLDRAGAVVPDFALTPSNAWHLAETCRRLDGIPLALELAAARLAILTPSELVSGLHDRVGLLSAGPRTSPERHQTLEAALTWSYSLLDSAEQSAFRRFSVFLTDATFTQACEVCLPESGSKAFDVVSALVEKSLLTRSEVNGETRLSMHETVREYAGNLLAATTEVGRVRTAHSLVFRAFIEKRATLMHGPAEEAALKALRWHHPDIQSALDWAAAHDDSTPAVRMVQNLWWYWFRANRTQEGRTWVDRIVRAGNGITSSDLAFAVAAGSYCSWVADDFDAAQAAAERALASALCPPAAAGLAHSVLARIAGDRYRFDEAIIAARRGEEVYLSVGDEWGAVWCRRCRAGALLFGGDPQTARVLAKECLERFDVLGDTWGVAGTVDLLAVIAHQLGDHAQAVVLARTALERYRQFDDTSGTRYALQHLAEAAFAAGDMQLAGSSAADCLELSERHGYRFGAMHALMLLARLRAAECDRGGAITLAERARRLARELRDDEAEQDASRWIKEWQG